MTTPCVKHGDLLSVDWCKRLGFATPEEDIYYDGDVDSLSYVDVDILASEHLFVESMEGELGFRYLVRNVDVAL